MEDMSWQPRSPHELAAPVAHLSTQPQESILDTPLHCTGMGVASHPGGARSSFLFKPSAQILILSWSNWAHRWPSHTTQVLEPSTYWSLHSTVKKKTNYRLTACLVYTGTTYWKNIVKTIGPVQQYSRLKEYPQCRVKCCDTRVIVVVRYFTSLWHSQIINLMLSEKLMSTMYLILDVTVHWKHMQK